MPPVTARRKTVAKKPLAKKAAAKKPVKKAAPKTFTVSSTVKVSLRDSHNQGWRDMTVEGDKLVIYNCRSSYGSPSVASKLNVKDIIKLGKALETLQARNKNLDVALAALLEEITDTETTKK